MELAFASKALRSICEDQDRAAEFLGQVAAEHLHARLADLRAADTISDLVAGNPTISPQEDDVRLHIAIGSTHELVCSVNHARLRRLPQADLDWSEVRRLRIDVIRGGSQNLV